MVWIFNSLSSPRVRCVRRFEINLRVESQTILPPDATGMKNTIRFGDHEKPILHFFPRPYVEYQNSIGSSLRCDCSDYFASAGMSCGAYQPTSFIRPDRRYV